MLQVQQLKAKEDKKPLTEDKALVESAPVIHFAHANGFPAASYKKMLDFLPDNFKVFARDKFGHDPVFPVNDNWENQVTELIQFVESNVDAAIYAVGHSFGGVISFMACCQRPDLFKGLIMLDPPIMTGPVAQIIRIIKKTPFIDKISPSGKSKIRKAFWSNDEEPLAYFKPKALFKDFDTECIQDYVDAATESTESGKKLSFQVDVETAIFRKVPHNINGYRHKLSCPAQLFTAQHTNVCFPALVERFMRQHQGLKHQVVPDVGHMFPFEKPQVTASLITETIQQWQGELA